MIFSNLFDIARLVAHGYYLDLSTTGTRTPYVYAVTPSDSLKHEWRKDTDPLDMEFLFRYIT